MRNALVVALLCLVPLVSEARPFRAMVTRTAETTSPQHLELGLRSQGFYAGRGLSALAYHQISPGVRFGIVDALELNFYLDVMVVSDKDFRGFDAYIGDIPIGLQYTFLETQALALGLWGRATIPVGTANFERLPSSLTDRVTPLVSDGSWDAEGTFVAEFRLTHAFRIMANLGYLYHGVRSRGPDPDFDLPDAIRYDLAATLNLGEKFLIGVEMMGRTFRDAQITPAWTNNAHQIEVIPHARLEVVPNLVLEAALGFAVTQDLQDIYRMRALLGFTYEFDLGPERNRGNDDRGDKRGRGRGRKRGK
jgi:hypothetical protein